MSDILRTVNQIISGLKDLAHDPERLVENFQDFVSQLPDEVTSEDTSYDDTTLERPLEERVADLEDTVMRRPEELRIKDSEIPKMEGNYIEPTLVEYGYVNSAISSSLDHIDIQPSDFSGNDGDLGVIAIATGSDGKAHSVELAQYDQVMFLRLERPVVTKDSTTTVYGILIGRTGQVEGERDVWQPGDIKTHAGNTVQSGWLLCDGSAVSRTTYANLFSAIGTLWGVGDGSTTFNLPGDGLVWRGYQSGHADYGTVGNTAGVETLDLDHTHVASTVSEVDAGTETYVWHNSASSFPNWNGTRNPPTIDRPDNAGEADPHEVDNRGPFGVVKYLIKY